MQTHEPVEERTLLEIGFWPDPTSRRTGPDPRLLVDPTWAREDRPKLAEYLSNGLIWRSYFGFSYCRFNCGIPNEEMGTATLTDGTWAWPEGLAHYVTTHHIALPDAFLEHARARAFALDSDLGTPALPGEPSMFGLFAVCSSEFWYDWAVTRKAMTR